MLLQFYTAARRRNTLLLLCIEKAPYLCKGWQCRCVTNDATISRHMLHTIVLSQVQTVQVCDARDDALRCAAGIKKMLTEPFAVHKKRIKHVLYPFVVSPRIELGYQVPETCVLSIVLRDRERKSNRNPVPAKSLLCLFCPYFEVYRNRAAQ